MGNEGEPENPGDDTPNTWNNPYTAGVRSKKAGTALIESNVTSNHELLADGSFQRIQPRNGKLNNRGHVKR